MATISKSLNSLYKRAMHRPMTIDGFTLYTKADGYAGAVEGESQAEQSDNYKRHCNTTYNSPTNIRKLFITGKGIAVQYYATPVTAKSSGKHWSFATFDNDFDLFDVAMKKMTYQADLAKYNMSKATGMKGEEPKNYKIDGNGIGIISHPWVCSNIEEIYFDWTMLISNEVAPFFQEFCTAAQYEAFLTKSEQPMEQSYAGIQAFFENFNMGGIKDIRKRFPRLRIIAMISKLQDILDAEGMNKVDLQFDNLADSQVSWYKANRDLVSQSGSMVLYCDLSEQIQFPNKEFTIKANQYKFDFDKLDGIIKAYIVKINDAVRAKYGSATGPADEDATEAAADIDFDYSEVEKKCIEIEQQYGEKVLKNALLFTIKGSGIPLSQVKKMLEQFSKPNRIRMAQMIGFKDMK